MTCSQHHLLKIQTKTCHFMSAHIVQVLFQSSVDSRVIDSWNFLKKNFFWSILHLSLCLNQFRDILRVVDSQ